MTEKTEKQNMKYCIPVLFEQKKKRKAGNLSGTSENEQTRGTKSYYVGCMNFLLTQPQAEIALKQHGILARTEVLIMIPPIRE